MEVDIDTIAQKQAASTKTDNDGESIMNDEFSVNTDNYFIKSRMDGEKLVTGNILQQVKADKLLNTISNALKDINTETNVKYLNPENYDKLGKFHKQLISNFGRMLDLVNDNQEVDYADFVQVFEKLFENKADVEKQYLWGLFFPDMIKHATFLNPFPVPVYSYKQSYTFHITPNASGNFVVQLVTPYMVEQGNPSSDVTYINDIGLDGHSTAILPVNYVAESRVPPNVFQAFVLAAASMKVTYMGRVDVSSGYFGGSYHLSTTDVASFDNNVQDFNYVDNSFNSIRTKLFSGISMIYFPQDSSFQTFKKPNANSATNYIAMTHRMNVYGRGLPSGTLSPNSVVVQVTKVYATLPKSGFEEIMGVHSNVNELSPDQLDWAHNFVKETGLGIHDVNDDQLIEKMMKLPYFEQGELLNEVKDNFQTNRREQIISKLKGYQPYKTKLVLNTKHK